ncbi:hypothetical protein BGZ65_002854 [Modicella reniformis]|uniref:Uncharacterized protein n=1 Tax=Modicella reniformis TaxID=1440133 RepID=A0A9P6MHV2_9FUNG|nr:hypothetical protein BGZ65_002854 [Modicella reniformis]
MKLLKHGATAAGTVVPPLAHFKVVEGPDEPQNVDRHNRHSKEYSEQLRRCEGAYETGDIEALEGADLHQLHFYLNDKDKGRILGDLFRMFTAEGHVKWVCIDHYHENYRKAAMQRLKDVVAANNGLFSEEEGIYIRLASNTAANQFYEAMVKARGVRSLEITLQWDVTLDDLRMVASAVTKANILRLIIHGNRFKGPVRNMINNGCRYDPIPELMSNGRIQETVLRRFNNFYQRINVSSIMATRLQVHEIGPYTRSSKSVLWKNPEALSIVKSARNSTTDVNVDVSRGRIQSVERVCGLENSSATSKGPCLFVSRTGRCNTLEFKPLQYQPVLLFATPTYDWCAPTMLIVPVKWGNTAEDEFSNDLAVILDNVTIERGSKPTSLSLIPRSLTTGFIECMTRVIDRSHDLQQLDFRFENLHEKLEQEKPIYVGDV